MKFGVIADCQFADIDGVDYAPERKFRRSPDKLSEAIEFFNTQELDFVVHLGDVIDQDMASFDTVLPIFARLKHDIMHVLGNHDFYVTDADNPHRNNKQEIIELLTMPAPYYAKTYGEYRCVFLDSNEVGVIEWPQGTAEYEQGLALIDRLAKKGYINAHPWNGALSDTQMQWLHTELTQAQDEGQKVLLFAHHAVFPEHIDNMLEYEKILSLFTDYKNIVAYMNGHNHEGAGGIFNDVPCVTFKGMVDSEENAYAIVKIEKNTLTVTGYGREKNREYTLR